MEKHQATNGERDEVGFAVKTSFAMMGFAAMLAACCNDVGEFFFFFLNMFCQSRLIWMMEDKGMELCG